MSRPIVLLIAVALASLQTLAAQTTRVEFDVVSIERSDPEARGGRMRWLPDGTLIMMNQPIRSIIFSTSPVPAREVIGLPDWANTDRYDVTTKPPAGSTPEQRSEMMRTMFDERMKLRAHVEERARDTFALVLARSDGRLGPQFDRVQWHEDGSARAVAERPRRTSSE
jgi:uncharacterized protein (TIGR03435 family)